MELFLWRKAIVCILLIQITLISCSDIDTKSSFYSIDYSFDDGWTGYYSIKIDERGFATVLYDGTRKKELVQKDISEKELDSLAILLNEIDFEKMDSVYPYNCQDCGYFYLKVNKKSDSLKVFVYGLRNPNDELVSLNLLSNYLQSISMTLLNQVKSVEFESKTEFFKHVDNYLPPLLEE